MQLHARITFENLLLSDRFLASHEAKCDDAELRDYLDRPAPSLPLTFLQVVLTAMGVAVAKVACVLHSCEGV
ncbi:MAG TPA: hypothetical protein VMO78_08620 [Rhizomicrobium sp.]|nr:hypothetical protein [Rhizomicrobium sp.]